VEEGVARLERAGFRVVLAPHAREFRGYLAGSPADRASDLHELWADPGVDAVLQLRGGYGSAQLLPLLDWELARARPKPLVGFSDTTALHVALRQEAGLVTFWGPTLTRLRSGTEYTWASFRGALDAGAAPRRVDPDPDAPPVRTLVPGVVEGPLVGGTTSLLVAGLGTPWEVDTAGCVLLLEDVGEEPYEVDRDLVQLAQAGKLEGAAGIVVGEHSAIAPRRHEPAFEGHTLSLEEIVADHVVPARRPAIHGLPLGHGRHLATVPLGVPARLDAVAGSLTMLEPGWAPP
jgi:muramoyltetrapeptide carboxypeptidase